MVWVDGRDNIGAVGAMAHTLTLPSPGGRGF
jgi:hypothetical protein